MDTGSKASPQSVLYQDWRQGPGTKAHLSDSPRLEALMQALLSFGPSAWLLAGCFFRFLRFRTAESVSQPPNNGGLLKAVSPDPRLSRRVSLAVHRLCQARIDKFDIHRL